VASISPSNSSLEEVLVVSNNSNSASLNKAASNRVGLVLLASNLHLINPVALLISLRHLVGQPHKHRMQV
jgi:hypothetical protein